VSNRAQEAKGQASGDAAAPVIMVFALVGNFRANDAAERWLSDHGFSVGSMQRGSPRGIKHGDWSIAKWRNLPEEDRDALDGVMTGDMRNGPVTITLNSSGAAAVTEGTAPLNTDEAPGT
jgi:hypothetical protein